MGSFEVFLLHELKDYQADLKAEVQTDVVQVGEQRAHQFRNIVHIVIIAYAFGCWALFEPHVSAFLCVAMLMFKFKNGHINYKLQPTGTS